VTLSLAVFEAGIRVKNQGIR